MSDRGEAIIRLSRCRELTPVDSHSLTPTPHGKEEERKSKSKIKIVNK